MSSGKRTKSEPELEAELRAFWTAKGVSPERQVELLTDIAAKAQPGASVGPFTIPVDAIG